MMEKLVQISIAVDEERIAEQTVEYASKQVWNEIERKYFKSYYGGIDEVVKETVDDFVKENRDVLIQMAVKEIANRIMRKKDFKEKLGKTE